MMSATFCASGPNPSSWDPGCSRRPRAVYRTIAANSSEGLVDLFCFRYFPLFLFFILKFFFHRLSSVSRFCPSILVRQPSNLSSPVVPPHRLDRTYPTMLSSHHTSTPCASQMSVGFSTYDSSLPMVSERISFSSKT